VPVAAETIALHTIFELMRAPARACTCAASAAPRAWRWCARPRREGPAVTCDVSINSLHLTDTDIGYFDSRMRLNPPLRQQRDRDALREGLADGTIDALVSDHTPVDADAKTLPFAEAEPGATGLELLLAWRCKWGERQRAGLPRALAVLTSEPGARAGRALGTLQASAGQLVEGRRGRRLRVRPAREWTVSPRAAQPGQAHARSPATSCRARALPPWSAGQVAYEASH
jgi:dihydroorotase